MRISARLDDSRSNKLSQLAAATNQGKSELLKRAIDLLYEQFYEGRPRPAEILAKSGFVGCGEAEPDLSERSKDVLRELLPGKHESTG